MSLRRAFWLFLCVMLFLLGGESGQAQVWRKLTTALGFNVGINPHNPSTLYSEVSSGQLQVSRNKGLTWSPLGVSVPISGIRHIFVHPKDTLTIFVVAFSGGLWRTVNEGASWTQVIGGAYGIDGESMDYDPTAPDTMFAGNFGDGAVYRSLDRGATWTFMGISGPRLCALAVRPDSTNILFAGTSASTISKSTDYGVTWKLVNSGGVEEVPKIVINPNNPLIAYGTTNSNGNVALDSLCDFWKTTDGGETWFKTALQKIANWSAAIDVQHPETLWVGKFGNGVTLGGMDKTTDGGASFISYNRGLPASFSSWNLRIHPLDHTMVLQSGTINAFGAGGVYRFMDTSLTRVEGIVRDSITLLPVNATLTLVEVPDSIKNRSAYEFGYYDGDPTLTPTVHVEAPGYYPKDTILSFVISTVQIHDILLTPLPFNSINGIVFSDLNSNGVQDGGEPVLSGWQVNLSGPINGSTISDAEGRYSFDSLTTGTYTISEVPMTGWAQSAIPCDLSYTVNFVEGTSLEGYDFGNIELLTGAVLLTEDFTAATFPPPCWAIQDLNGGLTWHRITSNNHSQPASARVGIGNLGEGKHNEWLFTRPIQLKAGNTYKISWWERTFINGGATGICSLAIGVGTSQNAAGMTQIINSRGMNTFLAYAYVEQTFSVGLDGEYYIGFLDFSADGNTLRLDDITLNFVDAFAPASIAGMKFNDLNNNGVQDGPESGIPNWRIRLTGDAIDSTLTDINGNYSFPGLAPGNYTVSEAPLAGWTQTFPLSGTYSVTLTSGEAAAGKDFGNFHPNSITVRKFEDADGKFATDADRTLKEWHIEIWLSSATTPTIMNSGETGSVTANNLIMGDYDAVEADSAGWLHLGYLIDGIPFESTDTAVTVSVVSGENRTVDFINAAPGYSTYYRSARPEDFATAVDAKNKHKGVKRKADKVDFKVSLTAPVPALPVLELKFNMEIDYLTVYSSLSKTDTLPYSSLVIDPKRKIWKYTFSPLPVDGSTIQIDGRGKKGKPVKISYTWMDLLADTKIKGTVPNTSSAFIYNIPRLPKPNLHNVGEELFPKGFNQPVPYFSTGMLIGIPQGIKGANSVLLTKYTNLVKSLIVEKTGLQHTIGISCLDSLDDNKLISKQFTTLPPNKQNNKLFAELVALKLNVAASVMDKFPAGLGELTFFDKSQPTNPFNNQMVSEILVKADSMISCLPLTSKPSAPTLTELYDVIRMINIAFADSGNDKDTVTFAPKIKLTGVKKLVDVPYLRLTPGVQPVIIASPAVEGYNPPETVRLIQNYPNPFNPTTTISFELRAPAMVSLKIYNMLGQEISTLIDREYLEDGAEEMEFDASGLPSGVYFYRLVAEEVGDEDEGIVGQSFVTVNKMLLLK